MNIMITIQQLISILISYTSIYDLSIHVFLLTQMISNQSTYIFELQLI